MASLIERRLQKLEERTEVPEATESVMLDQDRLDPYEIETLCRLLTKARKNESGRFAPEGLETEELRTVLRIIRKGRVEIDSSAQ